LYNNECENSKKKIEELQNENIFYKEQINDLEETLNEY
jgi:cell division protein FtsB